MTMARVMESYIWRQTSAQIGVLAGINNGIVIKQEVDIYLKNSSFAPVGIVPYLDGAVFPCSRAEIMICAEANEAPDHVLNAIERLPHGHYSREGKLTH